MKVVPSFDLDQGCTGPFDILLHLRNNIMLCESWSRCDRVKKLGSAMEREGSVSPETVVVVGVCAQDSAQVRLAQDHDVRLGHAQIKRATATILIVEGEPPIGRLLPVAASSVW